MVEARTSAELASLQVATKSPFGAYRLSVQKGIASATSVLLACSNVIADETGRFINRSSAHSKPSGYNAGARNVETPNPLGAHVAERHRWHDAWLLGSHIARESYSYPHRIQMFVTEH